MIDKTMTGDAARPVRFGLNLPFANSIAQIVDNARRAADVGFDVVTTRYMLNELRRSPAVTFCRRRLERKQFPTSDPEFIDGRQATWPAYFQLYPRVE